MLVELHTAAAYPPADGALARGREHQCRPRWSIVWRTRAQRNRSPDCRCRQLVRLQPCRHWQQKHRHLWPIRAGASGCEYRKFKRHFLPSTLCYGTGQTSHTTY